MKSEVAKWIASWPEWERRVARKILAGELTQPLWENDEDSREQREREKRETK